MSIDNTEIFSVTWLKHLVEVVEQVIDSPKWKRIIPVVLNRGATRFEMAKEILRDLSITVSPIEGIRKDLRSLNEETLIELELSTYPFEAALEAIRDDLMHALESPESPLLG